MENVWRWVFLFLFGMGAVEGAIIIYMLWRPLKDMRTAATKLENATERLNSAGDILDITKKYDQLIERQAEQTKHAVERMPNQIQQGVQKAVTAAVANISVPPGSGINGGQSGEIQIHS